jgi:hypothetical protein
MATFNKFNQFAEDLALKIHDFRAAGDTLKVYLSNSAPTATDTIKSTSTATEISSGNGYTTGGEDVQNDQSETPPGTLTVTGVDITWTASGGSIAQFRYCVLYNDTPSSPVDPLIGWWDNGSAVDLADGQSFTLDFGASLFTIS